ncbi:NADPH-dependent FMN reductase [Paenibacillus allorhizosphaerae]|uniref:NAD(P)H-dependent FMN reductase n=1 Tax=Paenibacillus allorhizosphaerae TaxID=2849866 RepID=A0ABM8VIZ9_9BACL|nr:NAD(P)H-dependent oxidoreductase [Paenibacillus allorhizosphaerae]CAG7644823.1 NAD(P)H-dependent FMN reductase [Paenibacillus allorhizosphaerae]
MNENTTFRILAISGSLRNRSSNTFLLRAAAELAPGNMIVTMYEGLGGIPPFNPDIDGDEPPASVAILRAQLQAADGVLICTPEYAGGVPGVLKNALDWIVSSGELMNKPAAVISASPSMTGGAKALESLLLTLKIMSAAIVDGGTVAVPLVSAKLNAAGELTDDATAQQLQILLDALAQKAKID